MERRRFEYGSRLKTQNLPIEAFFHSPEREASQHNLSACRPKGSPCLPLGPGNRHFEQECGTGQGCHFWGYG